MYQCTHLPVYRLCCLTLLLLASGCVLLPPPPTPTPTLTPSPIPWPTPTPTPSLTPWPTPTPEPPDTGWQSLQPGVELRQVRVGTGEVAERLCRECSAERLTIVRLEPTAVRFRIHYDPGRPHPVSSWARRLQQPLLVVNGGYFTPEDETLALLISDGEVWGAPYEYEDEDWVFAGLLGLFAVTADGQVSMRWLNDRPYDPAEPLTQALMSFPVLVKPGGVMGFPPDAEEGPPARRTVLAQDFQGRILIIVAPRGYFSLLRLARFLADSDLDLDVALNLDGGRSTGLWLQANGRSVKIDSIVPVPSVIAAYD